MLWKNGVTCAEFFVRERSRKGGKQADSPVFILYIEDVASKGYLSTVFFGASLAKYRGFKIIYKLIAENILGWVIRYRYFFDVPQSDSRVL
jgi:hypothetical protein